MVDKKFTPYISFISFARNDGYVEDRAYRHNLSINFLLQQLKDYEVPSELIIVEWNYPEDKPPLAETIKIEVDTVWTKIRIIRVPSKYHQRYKNWQDRPMHVSAAVNVGYRRANGKFTLLMGSDVFLTNECLQFIAKQNLKTDAFYRCDRFDVDPVVLNTLSREQSREIFLNECEKNIKIHHHYLEQSSYYKIADVHTNASGDFELISRDVIMELRGRREGKDVGGFDTDSLLIHAAKGYGASEVILTDKCRVYKLYHEKSTARAVKQKWEGWQNQLEHSRFLSDQFKMDLRIVLNYPKRYYDYGQRFLHDSFERNFVKPARKWAKRKPPFYLNNQTWGLENVELQEVNIL